MTVGRCSFMHFVHRGAPYTHDYMATVHFNGWGGWNEMLSNLTHGCIIRPYYNCSYYTSMI